MEEERTWKGIIKHCWLPHSNGSSVNLSDSDDDYDAAGMESSGDEAEYSSSSDDGPLDEYDDDFMGDEEDRKRYTGARP